MRCDVFLSQVVCGTKRRAHPLPRGPFPKAPSLENTQQIKASNHRLPLSLLSILTSALLILVTGKAVLDNNNAVFIRNMAFDITEEELEKAFAKYGEVVQAMVAKDARGLSRG